MAQQTANEDSNEPEVTRTDEFELQEAVDSITQLPNTREGTVADVWATFHTDPEEVGAVCESAFKNRNVVMYKADREEGFVSIVLEKFVNEL